MKKIILLVLFVGFAVPVLKAQNIEIKQVKVRQNGSFYNQEVKLQNGNHVNGGMNIKYFKNLASQYPHIGTLLNLPATVNQAAVIKINGEQNKATIIQRGGSNSGMIYINGSDNITSLSQVGNDFSVLDVIGNHNHFQIKQTATGVTNYIRLKANGVHMEAVQNESGMKLQLTGEMQLGISIEGQNIPVIISTY